MLKEDRFVDRQAAAQAALAARVAKFKARPAADDPTVIAREAGRRAIAEARAAREAVKEAARQEELRLKAEAEAQRKAALDEAHREAEATAEAAEAEKKLAKHAQATLILAQEVERKAIRDAKYAARKARAKG